MPPYQGGFNISYFWKVQFCGMILHMFLLYVYTHAYICKIYGYILSLIIIFNKLAYNSTKNSNSLCICFLDWNQFVKFTSHLKFTDVSNRLDGIK